MHVRLYICVCIYMHIQECINSSTPTTSATARTRKIGRLKGHKNAFAIFIYTYKQTDFDCWVDQFIIEQFIPGLLSYQFQPRPGPLCSSFQSHFQVPSEKTKSKLSSRKSQLVRINGSQNWFVVCLCMNTSSPATSATVNSKSGQINKTHTNTNK